jgi:hypothetical protein
VLRIALALCVLLATGASAPETKPPLRVLFIGNSLTSWNNLPGHVQAIARARGDRTLTYRMIAPPGVSLEDHWAAAGAAANVPVLPAGAAWRAVWRRNGRVALHARDGLHPSRLGTYLTALVVYAGLRDVSPLSLPRSLVVGRTRVTVPKRTASLVRASAAQALAAPLSTASCGG